MIKPILFNTEMVRAILDGRKTVTRRVIKDRDIINGWDCEADGTPIAYIDQATGDSYLPTAPCHYHPGDVLWVRETWCELARVDENGYTHYDDCQYYYATDGDFQIDLYDADGFLLDDQRMKWRPSIHMPKEAARLFLRVTDVRVERLQRITPIDCIREGVERKAITIVGCEFARGIFSDIWNSTIKSTDLPRYGWDANPWVWVIEFERCEKPAGWPGEAGEGD